MNAICAEPDSGLRVTQRWTSATRLPSVDSPPRFSEVPLSNLARRKPSASWPSGWAPRTFAFATAASTIAWVGASTGG